MKKSFILFIFSFVLFSNLNASSLPQDDTSQFNDEFTDVETAFDPLSGYNRTMTNFNDYVYVNVLIPVSKSYASMVNENIRTGIANVFDNLLFPIRFINNVLQFKIANASEELGRFAVNSTFGLLGIMDVAKDMNLKQHKEDFGQTLGYYGVGSGFHIVIPFLGPSNVRDIFGFAADSYANPMSTAVAYEPYQIPDNMLQELGYRTFATVNEQSFDPDNYNTLKKDAIDLYPFLRDVYEQRRKKLIEE